ncbi:Protein CBG23542 [Caenorhabditis briggsae]|uniref:Serpentine receptor class r-10 n=1 Tax=Caenorhabditis briggsae TaxID=6238 RepID=A8Y3P0_CAEBR|nr:Protein CBG23542 [Caenorhabditis briggsae]CAP39509.2 Protein CBG23542 [Caenorhabditis briggsae]
MSDAVWISITNATGMFGITFSLFSNCTLLALILCKVSPVKGPYKSILIFFCCFTMFYSAVEMFLRPIIHIYDDTLFVMQRKWFQMSKFASHLTTTMYCGCYAMSFVLFALQFLYRYIATCMPQQVVKFQGIRFFFWIFGAFCIALMFLNIVNQSYGLDANFVDYVPYRYFENDEGTRKVIMLNIIGIIQHVIIMLVSFGTLFYCAFKTYSTISKHKGMSIKTKELQMQLFRALAVQAAIPMIFMYAPLLFLYACPLINLQLGALANYQTIMGQLYPGVDPFAVLFLVNVYRRTLLNIICLRTTSLKESSIQENSRKYEAAVSPRGDPRRPKSSTVSPRC